jgi:hypothetical protein
VRYIAVGAALAIIMTTACHAQQPAEPVVALFKQVCADPTTPEAMIEAGEKSAMAGQWKLVRSGPAPLPMLHMGNTPKISYVVGWEFSFPDMPGSTLSMSIVRPPLDDIRRFSICVMQPATEIGVNALAEQIEKQFGSSVTKDVSGRYRDEAQWFFTNEIAVGSCGRRITEFFHQMSEAGTPTTLMFQDIQSGEKVPVTEMTKCPS